MARQNYTPDCILKRFNHLTIKYIGVFKEKINPRLIFDKFYPVKIEQDVTTHILFLMILLFYKSAEIKERKRIVVDWQRGSEKNLTHIITPLPQKKFGISVTNRNDLLSFPNLISKTFP